jgi:hypothetical protein
MTFTEYTLDITPLTRVRIAHNAQHKCIWRALNQRSRDTICGPSNVRGVSTSRPSWCNSNKPPQLAVSLFRGDRFE